ncbi:hypothetical protein FH972_024009 [Carpinus fangiana]|uniref:RNA-dependent RNA polymerase n=1 Tax=Carpinus fangiana TaxID=176857 RepID=A0A5N6KX36_9ROSI|nr:hypothetical protein FH972_024009 [Carpinus fangiana]
MAMHLLCYYAYLTSHPFFAARSALASRPEQPVWEQVISDINTEFGFHIIIGPSRPKLPSHVSREERCASLLRALWRVNETAVYHCWERLRDCWYLDRDRDCASLLRSFVRFLELEIVEERKRSPTAKLAQSFHVAPPQPTDDDLANQQTAVHEGNGGCTPDTEVANSQHDEVSGQAILPQGSIEHWHSYTLPSAAPDLDDCPSLRQAPFAARYECTRFALVCGVSLSDIDFLHSKAVAAQPRKLRRSNSGAPVSNSPWQDYPTLRKHLTSLITSPGFVFLSPSENAWAAALAVSPNLHMSADIRFGTDKEKAIFKLQLAPFHIEQKSRRLLRKFGASRFLFVKIPAFRSPPSHLSHSKDLLETRIIEWLGSSRPKTLAGNSWKFLNLKPSKDKRRKRARKDDDHHSNTFEAIFFAVDGPGLEPISIAQLVSWFMPLERNVGLAFAKAYARLELGFSTTFPTLQFMPDQPAWDLFRASHFPTQKELTLAKPAWKLATERDAYLICDSNSEFPKHNTDNILDHLIFNIAGPSSKDIHRRLCNNMSCDTSEKDKDLEEYFYQFIKSTKECAILNEFAENLNHDLNQILKTHWQPSLCLTASTLELKKDRFADQCVKFRKVFSDTQPRYTLTENHRVAQGRVLCYIKAHSVGYATVSDGTVEYRMPVHVVPAVMNQMKMRKAKSKATMPLWDTDGDVAMDSDDVLLEEEEMEVDDIAESSLHGEEFLRRSKANAHSLMNSVLPRRLSGRVTGAGDSPSMAPPGTNPAMRSQINSRDEVIDQLSQIFGSSF